MVTFDNVLPTLVEVVEGLPDFPGLRTCAVVRDLHGKVRLVVEESEAGFDKEEAAKSLQRALHGYFEGPIWSIPGEGPDEARLARALLERATEWTPEVRDVSTGAKRNAQGSWRKYERRLSKSAWLDQGAPYPPWPIENGPCITAFYSFKGGIGRTTALASCAWQLAEEGKRVVILDLDLEAPGIGTLLEVESERGLLDLLVDGIVTGTVDLEGAHAPARVLDVADRVIVLPAGRLNENFLEKLARLDFSSHGAHDKPPSDGSPVEKALRAILKAVKTKLRPDYIFLDARSGIHDLSGLSLHRLAHTDVLLSRAGEQSYQGFALTLRSLIRLKGAKNVRCTVVHSMATPGDTPAVLEERAEFRQRVYKVFESEIYANMAAQRPLLDTVDAPHQPYVIPFNSELLRFASIKSQRSNLMRDEYKFLHQRIIAVASTDPGDDE